MRVKQKLIHSNLNFKGGTKKSSFCVFVRLALAGLCAERVQPLMDGSFCMVA